MESRSPRRHVPNAARSTAQHRLAAYWQRSRHSHADCSARRCHLLLLLRRGAQRAQTLALTSRAPIALHWIDPSAVGVAAHLHDIVSLVRHRWMTAARARSRPCERVDEELLL